MRGRREQSIKMDKYTEKYIEGQPEYIEDYYFYLKDKTHGTRMNYITTVIRFLNFIRETTDINTDDSRELDKIKTSHASKFIYDDDSLSGAAKARLYYSLKNFFKFLLLEDIVSKNPLTRMEAPKDNKIHEVVYLTDEEIEYVTENILRDQEDEQSDQQYWRLRDLAIFQLGISTGIRVGSMLELNVGDIDFENERIYITEKGNKERSIKVSDKILGILLEWIEARELLLIGHRDPEALFISRRRVRMNQISVREMLNKYSDGLDKKITPHKLRATYATRAAKKTGNVLLVAHQLGHSNLRNTMRYMGVDAEMEEQAASIMDDLI